MKTSRVSLIACLIVLLVVCVYPSNVAAPNERYEERPYEVYDDGQWYCKFVVTLRVPDPIKNRRDTRCTGEILVHGIAPDSKLHVFMYYWEINAGGQTFNREENIDKTLTAGGDKYGFEFRPDRIPDEFEGRADFRIRFNYEFIANGQYIVSNGEATSWAYDVYIEKNQPIPPEVMPFLIAIFIIVALALVVRRKRKKRGIVVSTPTTTTASPNPTSPIVMQTAAETQFVPSMISIKRGYETAGQYLKVGIKIENNAQTSITDVSVKIDVPAALERVNPKTGIIELGVIKPGGSQSANFQLQPIRCVDDVVTGIVMFHDAAGKLHTQEMKPLELRSVCPMLTGEDVDTEWIMMALQKGKLKANKAHFKFEGDPKAAFAMAEARVRGLIPIDRDERFVNDHYIAYASYVGRTKYGEFDFATEITVTGYAAQGLLTVAVYSNEEAILSGFIYEVMQDVKKHIEITQEKIDVVDQACPECGGTLDMDHVDQQGYLRCAFCDTMLRVPKWKR